MNVLSLFSGIGGLDLAATWAGMTIVGQVEIDPFCQRVLAKHWPDVRRMGAVEDVNGTEFGAFDLLCGGIPCQPHSVAGQRRGASDERNLWPEFHRLVRATQPRWIVVENVPGLLSSGAGRFFGDILRDLAALGYTVGWLVCAAAASGAPHRRERVLVVAYTGESGSQERLSPATRGTCPPADDRRADVDDANGGGWLGQPDCQGHQPDGTPRGRTQEVGQPEPTGDALLSDAACQHGDGRGAACRGRAKPANRRGATESGVGQPTHGLPGRLAGRWPAAPGDPQAAWEAPRTVTGGMPERAAKLKALGNAVVPQQAYPIFAAIAAWESEAGA